MKDLQILLPDNFPLHGIECDAFETRLRDALHYVFDGRRVRQPTEQVDARRPFEPSDVLPLSRIGEEHAFEQCLTLDRCRVDDISAGLRRMILRSVSGRLGVEVAEPGLAGHLVSDDFNATNCHPTPFPSKQTPMWSIHWSGNPSVRQCRRRSRRVAYGMSGTRCIRAAVCRGPVDDIGAGAARSRERRADRPASVPHHGPGCVAAGGHARLIRRRTLHNADIATVIEDYS